jgi:phenylalanyl-tRNA synthetase beta chain
MGTSDLRLFEMGTVFVASPKGQTIELQHLALLATGRRDPVSWREPRPAAMEFPELRGFLEQLCPGRTVDLVPVADSRLLVAAEIKAGETTVGLAGLLQPATARSIDLAQPVLVAELNLKKLMQAVERKAAYAPLPRFPAITRDVAIEAPADLPSGKIADFFRGSGEELLESFQLFDVFVDPTGVKLPADRKSLAWSITYRNPAATMEAAKVDAVHRQLLERLKAALPVTFR